MIIVNVKVSREHYKLLWVWLVPVLGISPRPVEDIDESELDRYRSSWSMSSVNDVCNDLSMSARLYGFHIVDAVCVVVCFVFGLI